ncbi:MAG TPA: hypothetical protein VJA94_23195 [Candidatus Angelobacter sp.]
MEGRPSIFKRAWAMLCARPGAYATVTLLPFVVVIGLSILIGRLIVHNMPAHESWDSVSLWRSMSWGERLLIMLAFSASALVPSYLAARGASRIALAQQREDDPSLGNVLADMLLFLPVAIFYFLVLGIPAFLASAFFVVPGLLVTAAFALIIPAGIDGKLGPLAAIRRGVSLVGRVYVSVLAIYVCYVIFVIGVRIVLPIVIGSDDTPISSPADLLPLFVVFMTILLSPMALVNIAITLLYCDATLDPRLTSHGPEDDQAQSAKAE